MELMKYGFGYIEPRISLHKDVMINSRINNEDHLSTME